MLVALVCAPLALAHAASLDVTPDTLIERANLLRDARERPWDPTTGRLGNLRHVHILANDCTVRVVSGAENRLFRAWALTALQCASRCSWPQPTNCCYAVTT